MKKLLTLTLLLATPLLGNAQSDVLNKKELLGDVKILSADALGGRLSGSKGNKMAQEYLLERFAQVGLKPFNGSYKQHFNLNAGKGPATNLVGYIPGRTEKAIVITAHYDHVGEQKGEIYNGADDNASGVGALLAAAAYFTKHQPHHTLIFAALDAEELGLQGADAFLQSPPVALEHMLLNVNMDMLSINSKGELYASGAYHYPQLASCLQQVAPRPHARLLLGHDRPEQGHQDWTGQSDHYQFHKRQIPYVYFGVEDHPHYHQPSDDYENINPAFYADAAALVLDFLKLADANLGKPALK